MDVPYTWMIEQIPLVRLASVHTARAGRGRLITPALLLALVPETVQLSSFCLEPVEPCKA
jgi:hypothetical protein